MIQPAGSAPRIATYRLQFSPAFRFRDARAILPYLGALGISHLYASPVTHPRPGSSHGYDVCDPRVPNPELGSRAELIDLIGEVHARGLGWLQDVVPNHMALSRHNPFLQDVLRFGRRSQWSHLFDIDWDHAQLGGRVLLPILAEPYARLLAAGALRIAWPAEGPALAVADHLLPLSCGSVAALLARRGAAPRVASLLARVEAEEDPQRRERLLREGLPAEAVQVEQAAGILGGITAAGDLDRLVLEQHWQPAWWRLGRELAGYRRFFAVDDLIAVRCEDPRCFALMHALVGELDGLGLIDGLRIDHIDGLRDPAAYLQRLRERFPRAWIVVEKILAANERLPAAWPVDGTTGYDALAALTAAACDPAAEQVLTAVHGRLTGAPGDPAGLAQELRGDIDALGLGGDLDRTVNALQRTAAASPALRDLGPRTLRAALAALVAGMGAYRTYGAPAGGGPHDARLLAGARAAAQARCPRSAAAIAIVADVLLAALRPGAPAEVVRALARVQHLMVAVMAKGFEDTFLYCWSRCLALNEVGGDPRSWRCGAAALTALAGTPQRGGSLNATSTHDAKRGEDARARLAALTWIAAEWSALAARWMAGHPPRACERGPAPSAEERYALLQTLVASWPASGGPDAPYRARIAAAALKAAREAGRRTCWSDPDRGYEDALDAWLQALLDPRAGAAFQREMQELVERIHPHACELGLVQTVLKCTLPGVPDIYQGCEWHDHSLVDPDNRRAVDFAARSAALAGLGDDPLPGPPGDPRTKQAVLARCLRVRRDIPGPWQDGAVQQLRIAGAADGVAAFARQGGGRLVVVAVRWCTAGSRPGAEAVLEGAPGSTSWRDALSGAVHPAAPALALDRILGRLPCAVLVGMPG